MNPDFVQTACHRLCVLFSNTQIMLAKWRDFALLKRQLDPAFVVIKLRETGAACYEAANLIEDEAKKREAA